MKVAINSKTFRVVFDGGDVIDYKICDGSASSRLMSVINGASTQSITSMNDEGLESLSVTSDRVMFSWVSDADSKDITKIKYVPVTGHDTFNDNSGVRGANLVIASSRTNVGRTRITMAQQRFLPPGSKKTVTTPKPAKTYTDTTQNRQGFGSIFG